MAKYQASGNSYIEIDDSQGVPRDLSPFLEEVESPGREVSFLDVTGLADTAQRVIPGVEVGQELVLRGLFDDTAATGPDAALSGIVGEIGTVSYGPAGRKAGQRKITGEFLCLSYRITSRVNHQVRFEARFRQDNAISITTWS